MPRALTPLGHGEDEEVPPALTGHPEWDRPWRTASQDSTLSAGHIGSAAWHTLRQAAGQIGRVVPPVPAVAASNDDAAATVEGPRAVPAEAAG